MRKLAIFIMLPAVVLAGCAGKMDAQRGLSEEWRLRSLEENFLNFKETQREQEERGRDQQRKLLERMRAVEDSLVHLQEQVATAPQKRMEPLAAAPALTPAPSVVKTPAPEAFAAPAPSKPAPLMPAPAEPAQGDSPAMSAVAEKSAQPAPAALADGGKGLYDQGLSLVRAEHSQEGRTVMTQFLESEPNSVLVPNALYWIGESYYQEKNYAQAILTFKDVTRRFPKHHKAAASLLKIGMSYSQMGEKDNATLYLRALLKEFPKSEPAPAARKKLAELGG